MPDKDKPQVQQDRQAEVRTTEGLRDKILDVRTRVQEATKPAGPLSVFKITTST